MDTPVRITSIGLASLGAPWRKLTIGEGNSRWARNSLVSLSSSAPVGQALVPEQKDDLLEADLAGEFVDVVAGVDQLAFFAEHIAEPGGVGDDAFESFGNHESWDAVISYVSEKIGWLKPPGKRTSPRIRSGLSRGRGRWRGRLVAGAGMRRELHWSFGLQAIDEAPIHQPQPTGKRRAVAMGKVSCRETAGGRVASVIAMWSTLGMRTKWPFTSRSVNGLTGAGWIEESSFPCSCVGGIEDFMPTNESIQIPSFWQSVYPPSRPDFSPPRYRLFRARRSYLPPCLGRR